MIFGGFVRDRDVSSLNLSLPNRSQGVVTCSDATKASRAIPASSLINWVQAVFPDPDPTNARFNVLNALSNFGSNDLFTEASFASLCFFNGASFGNLDDAWLDLWSTD